MTLTWEPGVVPEDACDDEAELPWSNDARVSELMLRKFMFSSSWMRSWVVVDWALVEPLEDVLLPADV